MSVDGSEMNFDVEELNRMERDWGIRDCEAKKGIAKQEVCSRETFWEARRDLERSIGDMKYTAEFCDTWW